MCLFAVCGQPGRRRRYPAGFVRVFCLIFLLLGATVLPGCVTRIQTEEKLRVLEFTVLDKEDVPEELKERISEARADPFWMTYADQGSLYIARGYGKRETSGYSVTVKELCETENAILIRTDLLGPGNGEETEDADTYPYVVVQTEDIGKEVVFE